MHMHYIDNWEVKLKIYYAKRKKADPNIRKTSL